MVLFIQCLILLANFSKIVVSPYTLDIAKKPKKHVVLPASLDLVNNM